jgi:hypothetical protein
MSLNVKCPFPNPIEYDKVNSTFTSCGVALAATNVNATVNSSPAVSGDATPDANNGWWAITLSNVPVTNGGTPNQITVTATYPPPAPDEQKVIPIKVVASGGDDCQCTPPLLLRLLGALVRAFRWFLRLFGFGRERRTPAPRP